jgi:hypothetical protein
MPVAVLAEVPILAVSEFDSRSIITVVFCGDPSPHPAIPK